jgi:hypothetical protein
MTIKSKLPMALSFMLAVAAIFGAMKVSANTPMVAAVTIEPSAGHDFGLQESGTYSLARTVGIRSAGVATLTIEDIRFTGDDAGDFSLDVLTPCPRELEATSSCSFPIFFAPRSEGPKSARLEIVSNAFEGPVSIPVSGTGTPAVVLPPAGPNVRFTAKPKGRVSIKGPRLKRLAIRFTADKAGATFRCSVNGRAFSACRSPKVLSNLRPGRHSLAVRAARKGVTGETVKVNFRVVKAKKAGARSR